MELARKLAREMDEHRTVSRLARLRPQRVRRLALARGPRALRGRRGGGDRRAVRLPARARPPRGPDPRRRGRTSPSTPTSGSRSASSGSRRGWSARTVRVQARVRPGRPPAPAGRRSPSEEHGKTMIYSTSARVRGPVEAAQARRRPAARCCSPSAAGACCCRPAAARSGAAATATSCSTTPASRAATPRSARGPDGWTIEDLGSTNGVRVNGAQIRGAAGRCEPGDRIELGSTELVFEVG